METIINIRRKDRRPDTDTIYKELTKGCASNINTNNIGNQIKLMIDNGLLENRPCNQGLDSCFFILNSNIPISVSRNDIELEQLELGFSPNLATRSQVNFSVETPEIYKQIDGTPEIFDCQICCNEEWNILVKYRDKKFEGGYWENEFKIVTGQKL